MIGEGVTLPAGSLVVAVAGSTNDPGVSSVQTTVPVAVAGVGVQVVPGIVTVSLGVTDVHVTVLGVVVEAVHVGAIGGVTSLMYGTDAGVTLPAGSFTVAVGLDGNVPGVVSVHLTIPVASAGVGTQVVPGIVRVAPGSTPVHVITTAVVPLDGLGVAVHVGAVGAVVSLM
jgi:hypothetical protein